MSEWQEKTIGEISEPRQHKNLPNKKMKGSKYKVYGANGVIGFYDDYTHEYETVAITCRGATCGNVHLTTPKSYINSNAMALDNLSYNVSTKYLYYAVSNINFDNVISGSAQPQITRTKLQSVKVMIPTMLTQQKIASILSSVDEAIEKTEEIIQQTEQVKKGLMQQLLTKGIGHTEFKKTSVGEIPKEWTILSMDQIVINEKNSIKIGPFGSQLKKSYLTSEGYKVYGQENVFNEDFSIGNRYINYDRFQKLKSCELESGDFLITMMGTIGKCAIVPMDFKPGIMDSHLIRLKLDENVYYSGLLKYSLMSGLIQKQIKRLSVGGIMSGLNSTIIKQLVLPIPSIKEQKKLATIFESVDTKIQAERDKLSKLQTLKQGLMQQLLTGNVRVPVDDDEEVTT